MVYLRFIFSNVKVDMDKAIAVLYLSTISSLQSYEPGINKLTACGPTLTLSGRKRNHQDNIKRYHMGLTETVTKKGWSRSDSLRVLQASKLIMSMCILSATSKKIIASP